MQVFATLRPVVQSALHAMAGLLQLTDRVVNALRSTEPPAAAPPARAPARTLLTRYATVTRVEVHVWVDGLLGVGEADEQKARVLELWRFWGCLTQGSCLAVCSFPGAGFGMLKLVVKQNIPCVSSCAVVMVFEIDCNFGQYWTHVHFTGEGGHPWDAPQHWHWRRHRHGHNRHRHGHDRHRHGHDRHRHGHWHGHWHGHRHGDI